MKRIVILLIVLVAVFSCTVESTDDVHDSSHEVVEKHENHEDHTTRGIGTCYRNVDLINGCWFHSNHTWAKHWGPQRQYAGGRCSHNYQKVFQYVTQFKCTRGNSYKTVRTYYHSF